MRGICLLLLAALALSVESAAATAATPLRWEAGRASLATVLGRLAVSGNRVWLAEGLDDAVEAELPAVDGVWWDGIAAVCQAFSLRPDEGEPADEHLESPGIAVPIGHGTLVLSPGPPPGMQVEGGLLACAEGGGTVRLWLRAEPRVGRGRLAWGRGGEAMLAPSGIALAGTEPAESAAPAATWRSSSPVPPGARLSLPVQTAALARWTARCPMTVGETIRFPAGGQELAAVLLVDPAVTTWEGNTLPERRPLLALSGPGTSLQRAQVRLLQGETELGTRGGGSRTVDTGTVVYRYLRAAPEGAVQLEVEGRSQEGLRSLQLNVPLPPPARAAATAPPEASAPLTWDAGTRSLAQWLALLAASGNPVLPEVGVDTATPVALPALRGGFWNGVLAIADASGLAPAMPTGAALSSGAVRLVKRQCLASAVCGPLLLEAERTDAPPGELALRLRAALEPRLPEDGYGMPAFHWASWASDDQGRMHEIVAQVLEMKDPRVQLDEGDDPVASEPMVVVRLAAGGARRLELTGLVTLPRIRQWRCTADMAVNEPVEALLGPRAVELTALSAPTRVGSGQLGPGLLIRGLHGAAGVRFSLSTPDGQPVENTREANRTGGGPGLRPWLGWCRIPPQGRVTAELVARAALPPLVLPVRLSVPVPDGL